MKLMKKSSSGIPIFLNRKKGSSSVFLVMILASVITLVMTFVSAAMRTAAIGYMDGLVNLSGRSVLSEFDLHLKDDYGLFAFRGHKQEIISKVTDYLSYTLDHNDYIGLSKVDANTAGYCLADVDIFEKEVCEYTKYAIARGFIEGLINDDDSGERKPVDMKSDGRTLRNHKIIDQLPSGAHPGNGSIVESVKEMLSSGGGIQERGTSNYMIVQYIMHTFKNAQKNGVKRGLSADSSGGGQSKDTFFDSEAEYIIEGEMSDLKNRRELRADIVKIRNAVNLLFIWADPEMREKVLAAAELLGTEVAAPVAALGLSEAWALAEAENDMRILEHGKKVPLHKTKDTWATDVESVVKNKESGYIDTDSDKGLTYQGYLMMFLFVEKRALKLGRMMDLMQINIQGRYDRTFLIREHNMGFWVKAEADGREYVYDQKY